MNENKYLENQNETMGENSFMKKLFKKSLNQKGLTLIELLAVIVILAIIAAIAIPAIGGIINNSRVGAIKGDALTALSAANLYFVDVEDTSTDNTVTVPELVANGFLEDEASLTGDGTNAVTITKLSGGNTITGQGSIGDIEIDFNASTSTQISAVPNSSGDADGELVQTTVTVTR